MRPGLPSLAVLCVVTSLVVVGCAATPSPPAGASPTTPQRSIVAVASSSSPSSSPTPSAPESAQPTPTDTPPPAASPEPAITASPKPVVGACQASQLAAHVTLWEGAAGHRLAHVRMRNSGPTCHLAALDRPELVASHGKVLIKGGATASTVLTLGPGGTVRTLADADNYCGQTPTAPVTVAFVLPSGAGLVIARPLSPTDTTGVPPCLGRALPGSIDMQPWKPA